MSIKITRKKLNKPIPVYDITVPSTSTFVANNIVVHNCSEIMLPVSADESFVCNLSSINLERWDEIEDTDAVEVLVQFLDVVMTEFIDKTEHIEYMKHARNFALRHRALGLGALGWHSYLQSKLLPFESIGARSHNKIIFRKIRDRCYIASADLADRFGEPELCRGYGRRNTTLMAIAPTTSSSFILGQVSPSIEPLSSNYFIKDLSKGKFTYRNTYLKDLLEKKSVNNEEIWMSILKHGGSVQHLSELDPLEKMVFKTFGEISQREIVQQAADRQPYIDQGQSLNIMIPPETKPKDVNQLIIYAWEIGVKTLYYQRSANPSQELARSINNCVVCEA